MTPPPTSPPAAPSASCRLVRDRAAVRDAVSAARAAGKSIGLVPTMGALHAGHLSLVQASRRECGCTVVTVFVNPTQFGPGEDFDRYPRNLDGDVAQLAPLGVDLVFAPEPDEVYRPGHTTMVEVAGVAEPLEGKHRPGHFRGVATVVLKLFNMVAPDVAFFGQKDYQQSLVVRRLAEDLDVPVRIRVCPTVREPDGLALSSRNAYLGPDDRRKALALSRSLTLAGELFESGERDAAVIRRRMMEIFEATPGVTLDYLALADADTLVEVSEVNPHTVALVAARVGNVRLIDNSFLWQHPR
ncbi:MAG: pantoate--beta-alanine ligase [Planctomycetia bacterium]|nr:pantoate--beta-alanine ligase [Planctomycetia bacterium]